jgi:hypothetical protein
LGAALSDGASGRLASSNLDFDEFVAYVDILQTSEEVNTALSSAAPTVRIAQAAWTRLQVLNIEGRLSLVRRVKILITRDERDRVEGWGTWVQCDF